MAATVRFRRSLIVKVPSGTSRSTVVCRFFLPPILPSALARCGSLCRGQRPFGTCRRFAGFPCLCYGATSDHGVSPGDCVSLLICSSKLSLNGFPHFWQVQSSQVSKEFC